MELIKTVGQRCRSQKDSRMRTTGQRKGPEDRPTRRPLRHTKAERAVKLFKCMIWEFPKIRSPHIDPGLLLQGHPGNGSPVSSNCHLGFREHRTHRTNEPSVFRTNLIPAPGSCRHHTHIGQKKTTKSYHSKLTAWKYAGFEKPCAEGGYQGADRSSGATSS